MNMLGLAIEKYLYNKKLSESSQCECYRQLSLLQGAYFLPIQITGKPAFELGLKCFPNGLHGYMFE